MTWNFGKGRLVLASLVALFAMGCDHATKARAEIALTRPIALLPGWLELRYARNPAIAFSVMHDWPDRVRGPVLLLAGFGAIALLAVLWLRRAGGGLVEHLGFALVMAGALGNVADRLGRGYVVDFIHVSYWPIFNVADAALVVGAGLLLLARRGAIPPEGGRTAPPPLA